MAKKSDSPPAYYQVKESFSALFKGIEVTYRQGEAVHPEDPLLARYPGYFEPLQFPHDPVELAELPEPEPVPEPEPPAEPPAEPGSGEDDGSTVEPVPVEA